MVDAIFMTLILFLSCMGLFSLGYIIQNYINSKNSNHEYFVILPVTGEDCIIEHTIRSCMLKIDLGQLKSSQVIVWDSGENEEASVIAYKLSQDFGITYIDDKTALNQIIKTKIGLQ